VYSVSPPDGEVLPDFAILLALVDQGPINKILQALSVATLRGPSGLEARQTVGDYWKYPLGITLGRNMYWTVFCFETMLSTNLSILQIRLLRGGGGP
jgi:hypothetical protein